MTVLIRFEGEHLSKSTIDGLVGLTEGSTRDSFIPLWFGRIITSGKGDVYARQDRVVVSVFSSSIFQRDRSLATRCLKSLHIIAAEYVKEVREGTETDSLLRIYNIAKLIRVLGGDAGELQRAIHERLSPVMPVKLGDSVSETDSFRSGSLSPTLTTPLLGA